MPPTPALRIHKFVYLWYLLKLISNFIPVAQIEYKIVVRGFLSCPVPIVIKSQRNHMEVYINYKLIGLVAQTSY